MIPTPNPVESALYIMDEWLMLPVEDYEATVYYFAQHLPPEEVLEATEIAVAKLPEGGLRGFKYFCGVCRRKQEEQAIRIRMRHLPGRWAE